MRARSNFSSTRRRRGQQGWQQGSDEVKEGSRWTATNGTGKGTVHVVGTVFYVAAWRSRCAGGTWVRGRWRGQRTRAVRHQGVARAVVRTEDGLAVAARGRDGGSARLCDVVRARVKAQSTALGWGATMARR